MSRTNEPLGKALPRLLEEQGLSLRAAARDAGVDVGHLSRLVRDPGRHASAELAERLAAALGLPADFFPEYRLARVQTEIASDGELRDELYDRIVARL